MLFQRKPLVEKSSEKTNFSFMEGAQQEYNESIIMYVFRYHKK